MTAESRFDAVPDKERGALALSDSHDGAPLRVVHLGKFFHPAHGGIERAVRCLAREQAALGCRVRVICMDHERGRPTQVERDGAVEVIRLRRSLSVAKLDHCPDLIQVIRDSEADLIHLHTPNPSMIVGLLRSGDRRPLVVSHHSDIIKQRLRRIVFRPLERACYNRAQLLLAMSPPYVEGSSTLQHYRDRVDVLPIGLDLDLFLNPNDEILKRRDALRATYGSPLWFSCGRLVYYKGFDTAMIALREVPGEWLIAGDGPLRSPLERLAKRLGVSDRVHFLGRIASDEDLAAHHLAASAFWFPSNARSEAYGLVQVEAMASGCPVINTAIPHSGVSWVSLHEQTGLTVPVNDARAFAAASRRLLYEPGLRDRLASNARARAVSEFQCEAMGRRSLALYQSRLSFAQATTAAAGLGQWTQPENRQ